MAHGSIQITPREAMLAAIHEARLGIELGQSPFGCAIVKNGQIVASAHNTVWETANPTAHAEINAIRLAGQKLVDIDLSGCTLYATCEPCPMCFAAIHWAHVTKFVYGARIEDSKAAGFNELPISVEQLKSLSGERFEIVPDFMAEECRAVFREWKEKAKGKSY